MKYNKGALLAVASSALITSVAVGGTFAPSTLAAFTDTSVSTANTAEAGTLSIDVVDNQGNVTSAARVAVENASPAMLTRSYTLTLKNSGSLDSSLRVRSTNLLASEANLDDVLNVQVVDTVKSEIVYTGKISALDFTLNNLPSTSTAGYTIKVTWPDDVAVDDNPYMGATLSFDLTADASSVAGQ